MPHCSLGFAPERMETTKFLPDGHSMGVCAESLTESDIEQLLVLQADFRLLAQRSLGRVVTECRLLIHLLHILEGPLLIGVPLIEVVELPQTQSVSTLLDSPSTNLTKSHTTFANVGYGVSAHTGLKRLILPPYPGNIEHCI